jgi:hypothetical protein
MDLTEIGWEGVERIDLAEDREWWRAVVSTVINLWVLAPRIWLHVSKSMCNVVIEINKAATQESQVYHFQHTPPAFQYNWSFIAQAFYVLDKNVFGFFFSSYILTK